jgi:hypothetical protein
VAAARLVSGRGLTRVPPTTQTQRDLQQLETDLRRLESEYNMYFAGRLPKPPWETRSRIESTVKRYDRAQIQNYGDRFRFQSIQARLVTLIELWDRGLRARDEGGRPGTFGRAGRPPIESDRKQPEDRVRHVAAFSDPLKETAKLRDLYDSLSAAHREVGVQPVPFQRFAELVKSKVERMKASAGSEVAFRVAVKDGKVALTARALKGLEPGDAGE